jgi:uncharacterized membrane protein
MPALTPSQTIGPFFLEGFKWALELAAPPAAGVRVSGRVLDRDGAAVSDALIEIWQPDWRTQQALAGWQRVATDNAGAASNPATAGVEAIANKPPIAAFRSQPSAGSAPLTVTFTDQSKDSDGGLVVAVGWDFGDGATSTERNPTHLYTAPGSFVVTLTATDDNGATAQKTGKVEVRAK